MRPFFERGTAPGYALGDRSTQVKILVPGHQPMVALLGQRDELLKIVEAAFDSQILVRGNEIVISGHPEEAEQVSLAELAGRWVVLWWYVKAATPG